MLSRILFVLGLGLVVLWAVSLLSSGTTSWLTWLNGAAGLCAFGIAAMAPVYTHRSSKPVAIFLLSLGLLTFWILGITSDVVAWQSWWTFAFGVAVGLLSISGLDDGEEMAFSDINVLEFRLEQKREQERLHKSA